jgi:hypothetical protein
LFFEALLSFSRGTINFKRISQSGFILLPFLIQILSLKFIRDNITRIEGFSNYALPRVFSQAILMLSSLKMSGTKGYEYHLDGISNFDELMCFFKSLVEDDEY